MVVASSLCVCSMHVVWAEVRTGSVFSLRSPTYSPRRVRVLTLRVSLMHWSSICLGQIECNTMPSAPWWHPVTLRVLRRLNTKSPTESRWPAKWRATNINDVSLEAEDVSEAPLSFGAAVRATMERFDDVLDRACVLKSSPNFL